MKTYRIEEKQDGDIDFYSIDHLKTKKQAEQYIKEYRAYKPNNEFRLVDHETDIILD
jgi:hypothetical protein